jgi:hypothetical protein
MHVNTDVDTKRKLHCAGCKRLYNHTVFLVLQTFIFKNAAENGIKRKCL